MDFISPYGSEDEQQPRQNASTIRMIGLDGQVRTVQSHQIHEREGAPAEAMPQLVAEGRAVSHPMDGQVRNVHYVDGSPHIRERQHPSDLRMSQRRGEGDAVTQPKRNWNGWTESPNDDDEWEDSPRRSTYSNGLSSRGNRPRAGSDPISSTGSERHVHSTEETDSRGSFRRTPQPRGWSSSFGSEWVEPYAQSISKSRDSRHAYWPPIIIQQNDGCNRCTKIMISMLYVVGLIGCGFFLAIATGAKEVKTEEKAAALLANNNDVCLQGRIQQRSEVTLFLALEGLTVASVDGLDDIIETAVRDGYNTATGGCTDACNRWAYEAKVESEADFELENGNSAVYTEVTAFLSQRNCAPGETFASVYPEELDRMRRTLTLKDGNIPNQDLPSPAQAHELWPTVGDGLFEPTAGNGRGRSLTSSGTFFMQEPRKLEQGLDFQNIMAAVEENIMKALERYYDHAGFIGIQEVLIVQPDSDQTLSQIAYTRAAPGMDYAKQKSQKAFGVSGPGPYPVGGLKKSSFTKGTKSPSGGKTTKSPKVICSTKAPKSTKAPGGTKAPGKGYTRHERRLGGTAVSGGSSFRVGSIQLTDPTAVKFFDYED